MSKERTIVSKKDDFYAKLNPKVAKAIKRAVDKKTELIPLASYGLTNALGGGIGKGRIFLLYGNPSSGKSALAMESVGMWQKQGLVCAYVDVEGTWDNEWAKRLGVDVEELILIERRSISKIYNEIRPLLEASIDVIVIDSISMALPDAFIDEDGGAKNLEQHKQIGAKAKGITSLLNGIHYSNEETAVVLISQTSTDLSGMHPKQIPDGGKKALFSTSQIVKLTSSGTDAKQIKGDITVGSKTIKVPIGRTVQAYVEKNKMAPQGRACEYNFYYDGPFVGVDRVGEVVAEAVVYGVIRNAGAWFYHGDDKWQGSDSLVRAVKESDELFETLKKEIAEAKNIE